MCCKHLDAVFFFFEWGRGEGVVLKAGGHAHVNHNSGTYLGRPIIYII